MSWTSHKLDHMIWGKNSRTCGGCGRSSKLLFCQCSSLDRCSFSHCSKLWWCVDIYFDKMSRLMDGWRFREERSWQFHLTDVFINYSVFFGFVTIPTHISFSLIGIIHVGNRHFRKTLFDNFLSLSHFTHETNIFAYFSFYSHLLAFQDFFLAHHDDYTISSTSHARFQEITGRSSIWD